MIEWSADLKTAKVDFSSELIEQMGEDWSPLVQIRVEGDELVLRNVAIERLLAQAENVALSYDETVAGEWSSGQTGEDAHGLAGGTDELRKLVAEVRALLPGRAT